MTGHPRASALACRLALVPALVALAACGTGLGTTHRADSTAELAQLRQRVLELQQEAAMREVEIARLQQDLKDLGLELQAARERPPVRGPEPEPVVDSLPAPPSSSGSAQVGLGSDGIEESDLEEPVVASAPAPMAPGPRIVEAPPTDDTGAQGLYDRGYTLFHQKRYAEAETTFQRYLDLHPDSGLADNAQFWIGESRYARGDFSSALAAFSATVERYPDGNKIADALLKAGKCLEALGQRARAVSTYEEVRSRFPQSVAALSAEERLAELRP